MSGRWLLLRRAGVLWGVPSRAVGLIRREGAGVAVQLRGSSWLQADELLETTPELRPRDLPSCLDGLGLPRLGGMAVWSGAPVLLLDGDVEPPAALLAIGDGGTEQGARAAGPGER